MQILPLLGITSGLCAALIWSGFPVVTKIGLQDSTMTAMDITAIRFLVAGLLLTPVLFFIPTAKYRQIVRSPWSLLLFLLFVSGSGAPYILVSVIGVSFSPASHFGIIVPSVMLVFSSLGAYFILKERPGLNTWGGNFVIVLGILLPGYEGLQAYQLGYFYGDMLFLTAGLMWACFTIGSKFFAFKALHGIALISVISMSLYLPYYLYSHGLSLLAQPHEELILQIVYQGLLLGIVALVLYSTAVLILGATTGSVFGALVPGLTVITAYIVLNKQPSFFQITGALTVSLGMLISLGITTNAFYRKVLSNR